MTDRFAWWSWTRRPRPPVRDLAYYASRCFVSGCLQDQDAEASAGLGAWYCTDCEKSWGVRLEATRAWLASLGFSVEA